MKLLAIMTLLLTFNCAVSQVFQKNKNKININYTYKVIYNEYDTVKGLRLSFDEWRKLRAINLDIQTYGQNVESFLQQREHGVYELREDYFNTNLQKFESLLSQYKIQFETFDYRNEFNFHKKYPVKSQEQLRKEAIARADQRYYEEVKRKKEEELKLQEYNRKNRLKNDSIKLASIKQQQLNDSIEEVAAKVAIVRERREQALREQKLKEDQLNRLEKERLRQKDIITKYGNEIGQLILNKKVKIGWTKQMCIESWGKPKEINRTTTLKVVHEQWVYSLKKYLYFDNDVLTAIQD
jgi:hypothetical protein